MKSTEPVCVRVTHRFSASAERVYDAWLDPAKAGKFLFATGTGHMVKTEIDARVGGAFTVVERRNGEDVEHLGTYLELERPRRIVFSFRVPKYSPAADRVTIEIRPLDEGCELTLSHEMHAAPAGVEQKASEGWRGILEIASELLVDAEPTCGAGLAQHATVPAKIALLLAALAETLEHHRGMLDLADPDSRAEDAAYRELSSSFGEVARLLEQTAAKMAGYRELPMGAHLENAFGAAQLRAFGNFVTAQDRLLAILKVAAERDGRMFETMSR